MTTVLTDCSKDPRKALIAAGVEIFSKHGYDGATTRMIAKEAGVNLAAIPYYYGSKEDLYRETIRWITDTMLGNVVDEIRCSHEAIDCDSLDDAALIDLAISHLETFAGLTMRQHNAAVKLILAREQIVPTAAFAIVQERIGDPLAAIFGGILGRLMRLDPADNRVIIQVHALMSQAVFFAVGRYSLLTHLHTDALTDHHIEIILDTIRANTRAVLCSLGSSAASAGN